MNPAFYSEFEQRPSPGIWHSLNRVLMGAIILAALIAAGIVFIPILKKRSEANAQIAQLQEKIVRQKTMLARRTREVELLKSDPEYIELIARDRLDVMKEGETIIRLEPTRPSGALIN